ncbi:MAG: prolyl oligopeptidase [Frankiales bacterium]|nr:prolyl oligopeptidase [Frankiales bacterium]
MFGADSLVRVASMDRLHYPDARRLDLVEQLHGHPVSDPYRWLEDADSVETKEWSIAQDRLLAEVMDGRGDASRWRTRLDELLRAGQVGPPVWRGGRAFRLRRTPDQEHAALVVTDLSGEERVLVDPGALDATGTTTLDGWEPSPDGSLLAYQLSHGGDEESLLYVLDVSSGAMVEGPIDRCRYSPVAWLPDGTDYYYVRRLDPALIPEDEEQYHRRVYLHAVGTSPDDDVEVHGAGLEMTNYYDVKTAPDGRWLVVTASAGTAPRTDVWIADLAAGHAMREVQVGVDAQVMPWFGHDGRLYAATDRDAPRGRLMLIDSERCEYDDWRELVPERPDAVLEDTVLLEDPDPSGSARLLVAWTSHAVSELSLHDADTGRVLARPELPGLGAVAGLTSDPRGRPDAWLGWTDFATPPMALRFDGASGAVLEHERPPGAVTAPAVVARQVDYSSADGTTVRMFVLSSDGQPASPRPTVLYGYGGFGVPLTPAYGASLLAWVEAGGVWVVTNLRGGSEEGEDWHRAGMREHKGNVFDDFHAAAERLVADGWTTREQLGIYGGSNGGLLVGAALTQRPALYQAVVCSAPLLDMVRYEQFGLGITWNDEYGTAADATELGWLLSYSPYHHVVEGTDYPAVLFTVFDSDTRVDPLHARKLCAALQHATSSERPVLIRREAEVGHGARSVSRTVELGADVLAFLAVQTGLRP